MQQITRRSRRDVEAELVHAHAAREAAVGRRDIESMAGLSAWIEQLRAEIATFADGLTRGV